jgi:hypothetical protein
MATDLASYLPWRISGSYLEACNCEAICPCRRIGGRQGGRSTYGVCLGSLSWQIEEGSPCIRQAPSSRRLPGSGRLVYVVHPVDVLWVWLDRRHVQVHDHRLLAAPHDHARQ